MVQHEVKKKTSVYGTVAVLSAIVLVAMIYTFGQAPIFFPSLELPGVSPMKTFSSYDELRNYLVANGGTYSSYNGGPLDAKFFGGNSWQSPLPPTPAPQEAAPSLGITGFSSDSQSTYSMQYSTTNIQVAGVDEADSVKTDGRYIYALSSEYLSSMGFGSSMQNVVYIVTADPRDARVVSKITLDNNTYPAGIFLSNDNSRLVVLASRYQTYTSDAWHTLEQKGMLYRSDVYTFINVYDISDKVFPVLVRNFTISGSYFNSRMIGDYVYAVVSQPAQVLENNILPLPRVYAGSGVLDVAPSKIYYSDTANYADIANNYFTYTTFIGLNVKDSSQKLTNMTILMGGASTMYVSLSNIYVTYPTWSEGGEYTAIYRISVNKGTLASETAKGSVAGYVLNQYSMDEYNGNFRLATTNQKETTQNAVYVLNSNLTTVGELNLQNTEVRETIQSARFMGDKAYIVTFQQKDPFFVLDMSNPAAPRMAGKLEIPGYSSYLHPYDENHIIGLGMENNAVKLSLFDVTNVNAPTEIAKYNVQGDYSSSDALYEPKAFLFNATKQLLVIPVSITQYGVVGSGGVIPPVAPNPSGKDIGIAPTQGGYWQGAYVFKLTLTGFELIGGVTHQENTTQQYYYGDYNQNVNRALYIGNTLYTVSNAKVKLNNLTDLKQKAEIKLS